MEIKQFPLKPVDRFPIEERLSELDRPKGQSVIGRIITWMIMAAIFSMLLYTCAGAGETEPWMVFESDSIYIEIPNKFDFGQGWETSKFAEAAGKSYAKQNGHETREFYVLPVIIQVADSTAQAVQGDLQVEAKYRERTKVYTSTDEEWDRTLVLSSAGDPANTFVVFEKAFRLKDVVSVVMVVGSNEYRLTEANKLR